MTNILYRSSLTGCNYSCEYCPFAGNIIKNSDLKDDIHGLEQFINWTVDKDNQNISVFFTPRGEVMIHNHYQYAAVRLSLAIHKVVFQTNLSFPVDCLKDANPEHIAFWCTYHPSQTKMEKFLENCQKLIRMNIRFSVGMVGVKQNFNILLIK